MFFFFFFLIFFPSYVLLFKSSKNLFFIIRNSCFGLIFGLGLCEILGFLLSPFAFSAAVAFEYAIELFN